MTIKNNLTSWQKLGLTVLIAGLMTNSFLFFLARQQWQKITQKRTEIEEKAQRARLAADLKDKKLILGDRLETLIAFFPAKEEEVAELAQKLETLAKASDLELKLVFEDFPEKIDLGGQYQPGLEMTIEIRGSYQYVVNWVREVERLPYFIRFSEVKVGTLEDTPEAKAELKGTIFLGDISDGKQ